MYAGQSIDHVIAVCDNDAMNCPVFPGAGRKLHWPFDGPAEAIGSDEEMIKVFRRARDEIGSKIRE